MFAVGSVSEGKDVISVGIPLKCRMPLWKSVNGCERLPKWFGSLDFDIILRKLSNFDTH